MSINDLEQVISRLCDAYYNSGEPLVSDQKYDELLDKYQEQFGTRTAVGAPVKRGRKLLLPMFSLDKIKDEHALNLWKARNPGPYVISEKIDGVSLQHHQNQLSTRGNGFEGGNIDHLLSILSLPTGGEGFVRAEVVMPISVFQAKYADRLANPRNMVSGLMNSKDYSIEAIKDLKILAYELVSDTMRKQSDQLAQLQQLGYQLPYYEIKPDITVDELQKLLLERKAAADYEIDGLVVVSDHPATYPTDRNPSYAMAFKMEGESETTTVIRVEWNTSKHGLLKPRVQFQPISLDGVTITWATGFNAKFILENQVGPGAVVEVVRAGAVIPYLKDVVTPSPTGASMPSIPYQWVQRKKMSLATGTTRPTGATRETIDGEDYYVWSEQSTTDICVIGANADQEIKALLEFFQQLGAKYVGAATITKLYHAGYQSLSALFRLKVDDFKDIEGFQEKSASRVVEAIQGAITQAPLSRVMGACGVFGVGFGEKKIATILAKIPDLLDVERSFGELCTLLHTAGLQTTASQFAECLPKFKTWLQEHPEVTVIQHNPVTTPVATLPTLQAQSIVFSGVRNKDLEQAIIARGGKVATAISGKTTILIMKQTGTGTKKEQDALARGVEVITMEKFQKKYQV